MTRAKVERKLYAEAAYCCVRPACTARWPNHVLHVHHIWERHRSGTDSQENLVVLCAQCHANVHSGQSSPHQLEHWKNARIKETKEAQTIAVKDALRYELPRLDRLQRNMDILLLAGNLLNRSDVERTEETSARLAVALARAHHRIGAAKDALVWLNRIVDSVPAGGVHAATILVASHYRARALIQRGHLDMAARTFSDLRCDLRDMPYGSMRVIAQASIDQLNLAVYQQTSFWEVWEIAHRDVSTCWGKKGPPASIKAEMYMYRGLWRSLEGHFSPAVKDMRKSLALTRQGDLRGRAIRLGQLALVYLRDFMNITRDGRRREESLSHAIRAFQESIKVTRARIPNETFSLVTGLLGIEIALLASGRAVTTVGYRRDAKQFAGRESLSFPFIEGSLSRFLRGIG